ncbi:MAG: hypothetical protein P1U41_04555 [Vicingaceae bacterium]|nr:hypothetical protein [Vicingaceae bacterium]
MQRNIKYVALTLVFLCLCVEFKAQQLVNPSFEGPTARAVSPKGWLPYGNASSPDTQPGAWKVTNEASHGYTYLSMVCRGQSGIDEGKWESIQQTLVNPLMSNTVYHYSIDLAYNKDFFADVIAFDNPVNLRVWGMTEMQQKELLWESGAVKNINWETYFFELKPNQRTPYLVLEAFYTSPQKYCGNVLLDNMKYYPYGFPEIIADVELPDTLVVKIDTQMVDIDLNEYNLPTQIDGREVHQEKELLFRGEKLTITVWDNRTYDGDVISLFLNEKTILKEFEISKNRFDVEVNVSENKEYYLTLYAHNLGRIPPNTVAMYITDGVSKKMITLTSNLKKCEAVKIKIEQLKD